MLRWQIFIGRGKTRQVSRRGRGGGKSDVKRLEKQFSSIFTGRRASLSLARNVGHKYAGNLLGETYSPRGAKRKRKKKTEVEKRSQKFSFFSSAWKLNLGEKVMALRFACGDNNWTTGILIRFVTLTLSLVYVNILITIEILAIISSLLTKILWEIRRIE